MAPTELQPPQIIDNQADMQIGFTPADAEMDEAVEVPTPAVAPGAVVGPKEVADAATGLVTGAAGSTEVAKTEAPSIVEPEVNPAVPAVKPEADDKQPGAVRRKMAAAMLAGLLLIGGHTGNTSAEKVMQDGMDKTTATADGPSSPKPPLGGGIKTEAVDHKVIPTDLDAKVAANALGAGLLDDGKTERQEALDTIMRYGFPTPQDIKRTR